MMSSEMDALQAQVMADARQIYSETVIDHAMHPRHLGAMPDADGYARVSDAKRRHWGHALEAYLAGRESLVGMILLMDIRHPLREFDMMMLDWCREVEMPVYVLLTKSDKLSRGKAMNTLQQVRSRLSGYPLDGIQLFSSLKRTGVESAVRQICKWLDIPDPE